MNPLEQSATHNRWAARPAVEKLLLFGGLLVCAVALPPRSAGPIVLLAVIAALGLARVRPAVALGALVGPVIFVMIGVVPLFIEWRGGPRLSISGVDRALDTVLRAVPATVATIGLACTTSLASLLAVARRAGTPDALCRITELTYRLVGILIVTAGALRTSIDLRLGLRTARSAVSVLGGQFATIFVLGIERARRLDEAMSLRAEPGQQQTLAPSTPVSPARLVVIVLVLAAVTGAALLGPALLGPVLIGAVR